MGSVQRIAPVRGLTSPRYFVPKRKSSCVDFFFSWAGLFSALLDIVLDVLTVLDFYKEGEYVRLGLLLLFLLGSSVLVQVHSWLWYRYEDFERESTVEKKTSLLRLKVLHVLQLGTFLRQLGLVEIAVCKLLFLKGKTCNTGVSLKHDVALLRFFETFSENLPQLVLMITTYIQKGHLDLLPVLKSVGAALAASISVVSYHRSLRQLLKDKQKLSVLSSVVYFVWNLLLLAPRVAALALFASELSLYVIPHFCCSWALLFFCAWQAKTNFMDRDPCGEWFYRATVGIIWYFNWFNVVEGKTFRRTLLYHCYILGDITVLWGLWFWKKNPDIRNFNFEHLIAYFCIFFVYIFGLLVKSIYYHCFHPNSSDYFNPHGINARDATEAPTEEEGGRLKSYDLDRVNL